MRLTQPWTSFQRPCFLQLLLLSIANNVNLGLFLENLHDCWTCSTLCIIWTDVRTVIIHIEYVRLRTYALHARRREIRSLVCQFPIRGNWQRSNSLSRCNFEWRFTKGETHFGLATFPEFCFRCRQQADLVVQRPSQTWLTTNVCTSMPTLEWWLTWGARGWIVFHKSDSFPLQRRTRYGNKSFECFHDIGRLIRAT